MEECNCCVDDCPSNCKPYPNDDHKDMVDHNLCVFVGETEEGVQLQECASTLVLMEAFLKIQLCVEIGEAAYICLNWHNVAIVTGHQFQT